MESLHVTSPLTHRYHGSPGAWTLARISNLLWIRGSRELGSQLRTLQTATEIFLTLTLTYMVSHLYCVRYVSQGASKLPVCYRYLSTPLREAVSLLQSCAFEIMKWKFEVCMALDLPEAILNTTPILAKGVENRKPFYYNQDTHTKITKPLPISLHHNHRSTLPSNLLAPRALLPPPPLELLHIPPQRPLPQLRLQPLAIPQKQHHRPPRLLGVPPVVEQSLKSEQRLPELVGAAVFPQSLRITSQID